MDWQSTYFYIFKNICINFLESKYVIIEYYLPECFMTNINILCWNVYRTMVLGEGANSGKGETSASGQSDSIAQILPHIM